MGRARRRQFARKKMIPCQGKQKTVRSSITDRARFFCSLAMPGTALPPVVFGWAAAYLTSSGAFTVVCTQPNSNHTWSFPQEVPYSVHWFYYFCCGLYLSKRVCPTW